jgi:uncharacterized membrane protein
VAVWAEAAVLPPAERHGVVAFFCNAIILALVVNVAAGYLR